MRPEDVPALWVEKAVEEFANRHYLQHATVGQAMRLALAAVIPEIEAPLRAEIDQLEERLLDSETW